VTVRRRPTSCRARDRPHDVSRRRLLSGSQSAEVQWAWSMSPALPPPGCEGSIVRSYADEVGGLMPRPHGWMEGDSEKSEPLAAQRRWNAHDRAFTPFHRDLHTDRSNAIFDPNVCFAFNRALPRTMPDVRILSRTFVQSMGVGQGSRLSLLQARSSLRDIAL
jgi:hypothetical protein